MVILRAYYGVMACEHLFNIRDKVLRMSNLGDEKGEAMHSDVSASYKLK